MAQMRDTGKISHTIEILMLNLLDVDLTLHCSQSGDSCSQVSSFDIRSSNKNEYASTPSKSREAAKTPTRKANMFSSPDSAIGEKKRRNNKAATQKQHHASIAFNWHISRSPSLLACQPVMTRRLTCASRLQISCSIAPSCGKRHL
jgi:hypothetical protein